MSVSAPLPPPVDLGFPKKFLKWYDDQLQAIDKIVFNPRRFTALGMPTGSGKSVTGMGAALLHPKVKRAVYLTGTKGLQDQLTEFKELGVVDVRGSKNYPCPVVEPGGSLARYRHGRYTVGCDEGPCHSGVWCPKAPDRKLPHLRPDCPYYGAVWDARGAQIVSTNYAMWFAQNEYAEGLGPVDLLILDEAHDSDKELENFLTIEISSDDAKYCKSKFPKGFTLQQWKEWAQHIVRAILLPKLQDLEQMPPADAEGVRERRKVKGLLDTMERLAAIEPLKWAVEEDGSSGKFCPIRVAGYAEQYLFRHIPHVVLMSATLAHKTMADLGIARDEYSFWEAPSRFPLDHRPVISLETTPPVRVNARMSDEDKFFWLRRIDRLIETRSEIGWKGLIHTVSYERMRDLYRRSEFKHLMVIYDPKGQVHGERVFHSLFKAIDFFKSASEPYVLVSPSIVTGYDFPHDDCRYQIIAKVPIPDMRGAIMAARKEIDKDYLGYVAMQKLVQACGRPVRGPEDWAETFIVDDVFSDYFYRVNRKHAPRWFQDAVERVSYIPDPLLVSLPA